VKEGVREGGVSMEVEALWSLKAKEDDVEG